MATILLVEDEQLLAHAYAFLLQSQGHKVICAVNGQDGLDKLPRAKPDLILLDMMMPVLDGLGFLRKYKASKYPNIRVILLSNMQSPEYVDQAMALGAYRYELKSLLAPKELLKLVKQTLRK